MKKGKTNKGPKTATIDLMGEIQQETRGMSLVRRRTLKKENEKEIEFDDFKRMMVLGRGAFGKVFLVEL